MADDACNNTETDQLIEGIACLLRSMKVNLSAEQLRYGVSLRGGQLQPEQAPQLLERFQISARLHQAPLDDISAPLIPCLLLLDDGSSLVLLAHSQGDYRLLSPFTGGELAMNKATLASLYSGWTLFAHATSHLGRAGSYARHHRKHWFKSRLTSQWRTFVEVALSSFMASFLAIATALFAMQVYDRVIPTGAFGTLWALAIGVFIAVFFEFVLKSLRAQLIETLGKRLDLELSRHIFQHAIHVRLDKKPASVGALASQIRDFESVREFFTASSLGAFGDLPFVCFFLGLIGYIGGPLVAVPVIAIVLMLLPALLAQPWLSSLSRQGLREGAVKNGILLEAIGNLESLKAAQAEGRAQGLWDRLCAEQTARGVSFRHAHAWLMNWSGAMQQAAYIAVIIFGVYRIETGELTIGALIACSILTSRAIAPTLQVTAILTRWQHVKVALQGLMN